MAEEALNDVGSSNTNMTVILNDNQMSISKNVGGVPMLLSKIRTKKTYKRSNNFVKRFFNKVPIIGKPIVNLAHSVKKGIKQLVIPNMYFEDIGFTYLGPVDGHNIEQLENMLKKSKNIEGPVLLHVITKKGKGYKIAEDNPDKFHSTPSFNIDTGEPTTSKKADYSKIFGEKLVKLATQNDKIVAITAAMKDGTGLTNFAQKYPYRFFDAGIAEQHALGMAAGMAKNGLIPVVSIYSSFLQRGYDQLIHDIAIQNLPVVICVDRAGIVGNDGETHQGIFDLSFLNTIPNINILAPKDFCELEQMLEFAVNLKKPVAIRYPRGGEEIKYKTETKIELVKAEVLQEGTDLTIIAIGKMVAKATKIAEELQKQNVNVEVINARFLKPLDKETILNSIFKTKKVITIEDGLIKGGLGESIIKTINDSKLENIKVQTFGYNDCFVEHGSVQELEKKYGLDEYTIYDKIRLYINENN